MWGQSLKTKRPRQRDLEHLLRGATERVQPDTVICGASKAVLVGTADGGRRRYTA